MHTFKPYADDPYLCVAELPCGDTCNQSVEYHAVESPAETGKVKP